MIWEGCFMKGLSRFGATRYKLTQIHKILVLLLMVFIALQLSRKSIIWCFCTIIYNSRTNYAFKNISGRILGQKSEEKKTLKKMTLWNWWLSVSKAVTYKVHHAHLSRLPHTLGVPALQRTRPSEDTESAVHLLSSNGAWSPSPEQTEKPGISHPPKIKISPHIYRLEGHSETWPWAIRAQGAPREGRCFVIAVIMRGSNKASGFSCCFAEIKVKSAFAAWGL